MTLLAEHTEDQERERLERVAALTDPATTRYIETMGIAPGWRCAEVGAGTGSIARWMSHRTGPTGKVVAVDIDTDQYRGPVADNVEVRRQDIVATPLEERTYDLVHVKILLMHLPERDRVLRQLVAALKPGGHLLVEEADIRTIQTVSPPSPLLTRAASALSTFFHLGGADPGYGLKLMPAVRRTGLVDIGTDCQLTAVQCGTPEIQTISRSLAKLAPIILQAGLMGEKEVQATFELLEQPSDTMVYTPITVSVWGRRPFDDENASGPDPARRGALRDAIAGLSAEPGSELDVALTALRTEIDRPDASTDAIGRHAALAFAAAGGGPHLGPLSRLVRALG